MGKTATASGTEKATMRAWAIDSYDAAPIRLADLPIPKPTPNDVLIRMHAGEVGDWDLMVQEGQWSMDRPFPLVLGLAGAGTVAAAGRLVTDFSQNDRVYAYSYPLYDNGAWAEYMLVPESYVAHAPLSLDLRRAGAVPIVGLTAHETLNDILKVQAGDLVLITAAAGGVGHIAVQIAVGLRAHVLGTARRRNHDFVRGLGAEDVIDYTDGDLVEAIRARAPRGVDKILNGVAGDTANQLVRTLRDGGRMVDLTGSASVVRSTVTVETEYVVRGDANRLKRLARLIDDEHLLVEIQEVIPFEAALAALELIKPKHIRGKLVIEIGEH